MNEYVRTGRECALQAAAVHARHRLASIPRLVPVTPIGHSMEGQIDDHPIELEGIEKRDFEEFVDILYPQ